MYLAAQDIQRFWVFCSFDMNLRSLYYFSLFCIDVSAKESKAEQEMKFFILFALVMMHSIMFLMIHEVSSSDDYLSCTASSGGCKFVFKGTQGAQKFD